MKVKLGKPLDVLSLKQRIVEDFGTQVERIRKDRTARFSSSNLEKVTRCPICEARTQGSKLVFEVYGALYHQCSSCSHVFVLKRPTRQVLSWFYSSNAEYASTYTDCISLETRVRQVAIPKAEWMIKQFEELYGRKPKSVLDIGAGMGHFVHACRLLEVEAYGIEPSRVSRAYCPKEWNIKLVDEAWEAFPDVDIITFWGLLEHVPDPVEFLQRANRLLYGRDTMIIVEVPRWNCISTSVQRLFPNSIVRHLDPLGHIQFFTDKSLETALENSKFTLITKWYFGMDAYEVTMQLAYLWRNKNFFKVLGKTIPVLQWAIDQMKQCDTIVLGAKP